MTTGSEAAAIAVLPEGFRIQLDYKHHMMRRKKCNAGGLTNCHGSMADSV
jgi:hypothetical protein